MRWFFFNAKFLQWQLIILREAKDGGFATDEGAG